MGTIIEATRNRDRARNDRWPRARWSPPTPPPARAWSARTGRPGELDLLINAGVYHDRILSEPAFASLIQEDIGANPRHPPGAGHGTFSFDVSNGACGLLTGIHLVDGMLASGTAKLGMVVASDMNPEPGVSRGFGFPAVGGAVLLSADDSRAGFTAFHFATFPEFAELFQSYVDWQEDAGRGLAPHGRNILTVEIAESYAARALECAESTARELAAAQALDLGEVDLLVATASVAGFGDALAARLGVSAERVASPSDGLAASRTRPRPRWRSSPSDSRRRARRCSSRRARGSPSPPRSTGHDLSVRRQRAQHADVARLRALLAPVGERRAPHRSGPHAASCDRWRESWPRSRGASAAAAPRTYSRRSANTRACSAPGCATRRT